MTLARYQERGQLHRPIQDTIDRCAQYLPHIVTVIMIATGTNQPGGRTPSYERIITLEVEQEPAYLGIKSRAGTSDPGSTNGAHKTITLQVPGTHKKHGRRSGQMAGKKSVEDQDQSLDEVFETHLLLARFRALRIATLIAIAQGKANLTSRDPDRIGERT